MTIIINMHCNAKLAFKRTSGQSNMTKGRIAAEHESLNRTRQVAPMCTLSNTWFLGPTQVHISNGISNGSAISARLADVPNRETALHL